MAPDRSSSSVDRVELCPAAAGGAATSRAAKPASSAAKSRATWSRANCLPEAVRCSKTEFHRVILNTAIQQPSAGSARPDSLFRQRSPLNQQRAARPRMPSLGYRHRLVQDAQQGVNAVLVHHPGVPRVPAHQPPTAGIRPRATPATPAGVLPKAVWPSRRPSPVMTRSAPAMRPRRPHGLDDDLHAPAQRGPGEGHRPGAQARRRRPRPARSATSRPGRAAMTSPRNARQVRRRAAPPSPAWRPSAARRRATRRAARRAGCPRRRRRMTSRTAPGAGSSRADVDARQPRQRRRRRGANSRARRVEQARRRAPAPCPRRRRWWRCRRCRR